MGKTTPCGGILAPSERGLSAKPTGGVRRGRQIAGNKDAPPPRTPKQPLADGCLSPDRDGPVHPRAIACGAKHGASGGGEARSVLIISVSPCSFLPSVMAKAILRPCTPAPCLQKFDFQRGRC